MSSYDDVHPAFAAALDAITGSVVRPPRTQGFFLIWSIEHTAWWKPGWDGYTTAIAEAGHYTEAEADEILKRANLVRVNECKVPLEAVR